MGIHREEESKYEKIVKKCMEEPKLSYKLVNSRIEIKIREYNLQERRGSV